MFLYHDAILVSFLYLSPSSPSSWHRSSGNIKQVVCRVFAAAIDVIKGGRGGGPVTDLAVAVVMAVAIAVAVAVAGAINVDVNKAERV